MSLFVTRLLERGADPTATDTNLNSALHLAARRGITTVAKQLVEFGAVLEAKNTNSETPLELAIEGRHNNVATFLVKSMRPIRCLKNKNPYTCAYMHNFILRRTVCTLY